MRLIGAAVLAAVSCLAFSACAAQTDPASNIGALTATLNAHGHTDYNPGHYFFQYSTRAADLDTQPGRRTPTRTIPPHVPPNGGNVPFGESVGGLTPETTYYYRVCGWDQNLYPPVCARTLQFATGSSPTFSAHLFAASGQQRAPMLDDITSIGSRLYVSGGGCEPPSHDPFDPCAVVGSLALDGSKKRVDFPQDAPSAITRGPDGDPWVLTAGNNLDTGGVLTHFGLDLGMLPGSVDFGLTSPRYLTTADQALWVIATRSGGISGWRTDGSPACCVHPLDDPGVTSLEGITKGPDGALWVTSEDVFGGGAIWRLTTDGQNATEYPLGIVPHSITAGPDGAIWFTAQGKIGRLSTAGDVRLFTVPSQPNATPVDITAGPDGALWFTEGSAKKLGRITTDGHFTEYPITPLLNGAPGAITVGPDQALWFTDYQGGSAYIVRVG